MSHCQHANQLLTCTRHVYNLAEFLMHYLGRDFPLAGLLYQTFKCKYNVFCSYTSTELILTRQEKLQQTMQWFDLCYSFIVSLFQ